MRQVAADLQPPVGYDDRWVVLAAAAVLLVGAYYATVWWSTRAPTTPRSRASAPMTRDRCLSELDAVEQQAASGAISARVAHQQVSRVVRTFVQHTTGLPVQTMTLAGLSDAGPPRLAALVEVLYPPEFGPGERAAVEALDGTLVRARELVRTWA